jgi:RNA-directed DNA polymerase
VGIPTYEDKILQRAVLEALEPVYETDFLDVSHGFRPGRGAHGALESLWQQEMNMRGGWIVDVDLRKFFDTIDHGHLREFLKRRVRDGVILRLIGKWLNAGVLEKGVLTIPDDGTPQGGVISPLLANLFLHYVLDEWFEKDVRPRLKGKAFLIRYADDFVIGVARADDAQRIMEVLPKRMSKYGLTVHPEKTRVVRFQPPRAANSATEERDPPEPTTFDFLGFTHYWGRSQRGDSSERSQRCRNGVVKTGTFRSRSNTKSSRKNCGATMGTTGSLATSTASRNSGRLHAGSGDGGCLGVAEANECRGPNSLVWRSDTVFPASG